MAEVRNSKTGAMLTLRDFKRCPQIDLGEIYNFCSGTVFLESKITRCGPRENSLCFSSWCRCPI